MELTRRHALAGAAGIAATSLLPSTSAEAAAPPADKQAPSFYRYMVGGIQVTASDLLQPSATSMVGRIGV